MNPTSPLNFSNKEVEKIKKSNFFFEKPDAMTINITSVFNHSKNDIYESHLYCEIFYKEKGVKGNYYKGDALYFHQRNPIQIESELKYEDFKIVIPSDCISFELKAINEIGKDYNFTLHFFVCHESGDSQK